MNLLLVQELQDIKCICLQSKQKNNAINQITLNENEICVTLYKSFQTRLFFLQSSLELFHYTHFKFNPSIKK